MKRKPISRATYIKRAKILKKLGYEISYKANSRAGVSGPKKAAITRLWFDKAFYYATNPDKNRFEFKRFRSTSAKREWEAYASENQIFPGGVFIQRPKGVAKGKYKLRRKKNGTLEITTSDKRRIKDIIVRLDMSAVAADSKAALEKALKNQKRPRQFLLSVNGIDSEKQSFTDLESFNRYLEDELIPELTAASFNFRKWGKRVFGLRLRYSQKGEEKAEGEGQTFNFKTGGIFDRASKKVYGRRKFEARAQFKVKKGRRKGT